jgi:hypothetical protein
MAATLQLPLPPWALAPAASVTMSMAFVVAYPLSVRTEPVGEAVAWPAIYPSAAINFPPSANVGGMIISLGAVLMSWALAVRYAENKARLGDELAWLNGAATATALVGMVFCPLGVAAWPWHEGPRMHNLFAYSLFYLGASYLLMQVSLDRRCEQLRPGAVSATLRHGRLALVAVGVVAMLSYIVCFGAVGGRATSLLPESAAIPGEAFLELLCLLLLFLFVASFGFSQAGLTLETRVVLGCEAEAPRGEATAATPLLSKGGYNSTGSA